MDVLSAKGFDIAGAPSFRAPPSGLKPGDIRRFIGRRRWAIAIPMVVALGSAATYMQVAESIFTAKAQIIIDPRLPQFIPGRTQDSVMAWDTAQVESEVAVLTSERIATLVVSALDLTKSDNFRAKPTLLGGILQHVLPQSPTQEVDRLQEAIGLIASGLSVRRTGLSYAIDIEFSYTDPATAQRIANAVADAYIADQLRTRSEAARVGGDWLQQRMVSLRSQMNAAAQAAQAFRAVHDYRLPAAPPQKSPGTGSNAGSGEAKGETTGEELDAAAATYRRIYESFLQSYTESVQRQSFPVSDAHLLTSARLPLVRSAPKALLIYALGTLLGFLAGVGIALVRDNFDRTVRSAIQVAGETGLDWLGNVPRVRRRWFFPPFTRNPPRPRRSRPAWGLGRCELGVRELHGLEWRRLRRKLYFWAVADGRNRAFCQGIVTVKTHIGTVVQRKRLGCIGVTAAGRGAGVSTLISNLAVLSASYGEKVLLIDADIWTRTLSRTMQLAPKSGVYDVLSGDCSVEEAGLPLTRDGGLVMLGNDGKDTSGRTIRELETVIRHALETYDTVLVDLPPVLPAAEVLALSPMLDGVILAVEEGRTAVGDVAAAAKHFERAQARVLGFVLTKASA